MLVIVPHVLLPVSEISDTLVPISRSISLAPRGSPEDQAFHLQVTESSKQPIKARYIGHVTGYQPISDQCLLIRSVHAFHL